MGRSRHGTPLTQEEPFTGFNNHSANTGLHYQFGRLSIRASGTRVRCGADLRAWISRPSARALEPPKPATVGESPSYHSRRIFGFLRISLGFGPTRHGREGRDVVQRPPVLVDASHFNRWLFFFKERMARHTVTLAIPGIPVGKARPRVTRQGHTYTPKRTKDAEKRIQECWQLGQNSVMLFGPLAASLKFYFPPPKPWRKRQPRPAVPRMARPDLDNLVKTVLDALEGRAYATDAQIVKCDSEKWNLAEHSDDYPRTEIILQELEDFVP